MIDSLEEVLKKDGNGVVRAYPKNPFKMTNYLYSSAFICVHLWFQIS
jgi:hypothetical protein